MVGSKARTLQSKLSDIASSKLISPPMLNKSEKNIFKFLSFCGSILVVTSKCGYPKEKTIQSFFLRGEGRVDADSPPSVDG